MKAEGEKILDVYERLKDRWLASFGERAANQTAKWILEDGLNLEPSSSQRMSQADAFKLEDMAARIDKGEPLDYVLGHSSFFGYTILVNQHVLIPRPETEELVNWIIEDSCDDATPCYLDIGTGSGCIPIVLKLKFPDSNVCALDISKEALALSRESALLNNVEISLFRCDILNEEIPNACKNHQIWISNPPYVTKGEVDLSYKTRLQYEPDTALFVPEDDPLLFYRKIMQLAMDESSKCQTIYFEISEFREKELRSLCKEMDIDSCEFRKDLQGKTRMLRILL